MPSDAQLEIRCFATGVFQQNTWLVREKAGGTTLLFDAGDGIADLLRKPGVLVNGRLDAVLLTHTHMDHVWGLAGLKRAFPSAPVHAHESELPLLRSLPRQGAMIGFPAEIEAAPDPDVLVAPGARLRFGGIEAAAIHTPGHTPGGLCWLLNNRHLFAGDMVFAGSVGRTDLPGGNPSAMVDSLRRLLELDDAVVIYSGHGPESTIGEERAENPYLQGLA